MLIVKRTVRKGIHSFRRDDQASSLLPVLVLFLANRRSSVVRKWIVVWFTLQGWEGISIRGHGT